MAARWAVRRSEGSTPEPYHPRGPRPNCLPYPTPRVRGLRVHSRAMDLRARLLDLKHQADAAVWRVRTVGRVGIATGIAGNMRAPGVAALVRQSLRGGMNPSMLFRYHAANNPHGTALVAPAGAHGATAERAYSFFEMNDTVDRVAAGFAAKGVRRGDSVLIALKNRPEFILLQSA